VKFAPSGLAKNMEDAIVIANTVSYPVVIKIVSDEISHKTDVGGVKVGIKDDTELENSYKKMINDVRKKSPNAKIKGVLVQKMLDGTNVLIGGKRDPQFGPIIAFGLGGIFVEIMEDVSFRVAPIDKKEAMRMMQETKGFKILKDYRGKSYDVDVLANLLVKISKMLERRNSIVELDINPLIVMKKGALAVDARIVVDD
jgi:acyl-CoA synthetase (NDP forming)